MVSSWLCLCLYSEQDTACHRANSNQANQPGAPAHCLPQLTSCCLCLCRSVFTDRFVAAALQFLNKVDVLPPAELARALGILKAVLVGVTSVLGAAMLLLGIIFKKQQLAKKAAASPAGGQCRIQSAEAAPACALLCLHSSPAAANLATASHSVLKTVARVLHPATCVPELQFRVCRRLPWLQIGRMAARAMPPWGCQSPWRCYCGWWQLALWPYCAAPLPPQEHLLSVNWQLGRRSRE